MNHFTTCIYFALVVLATAELNPSLSQRGLTIKNIEESNDMMMLLDEGYVADDFHAYLQGVDQPIVGKDGFRKGRMKYLANMRNINQRIENIVETGNVIVWEKYFTFQSKACDGYHRLHFIDRLELNEKGQIKTWHSFVDGGMEYMVALTSCKGKFRESHLIELVGEMEKYKHMDHVYENAVEGIEIYDPLNNKLCKDIQSCNKLFNHSQGSFLQRFTKIIMIDDNTALVKRDFEFFEKDGCIAKQRDFFKIKLDFPSGKIAALWIGDLHTDETSWCGIGADDESQLD